MALGILDLEMPHIYALEMPEVVSSIPTQDKYLCDEHEYLFCLGVIYLLMFVFKTYLNMYISCLVTIVQALLIVWHQMAMC